MRKLIKKTALFLIPIVILACIFEMLLRQIPNNYAYKKQYLDANAQNIEVLFLGNSHSFYGIDPQFITPKSFNASSISQSLDYDLKILEKYDSNWKKLKYLVLPVDYFSLYNKIDSGIEAWRVKNYNIYYKMYSDLDPANYFEMFANKTQYNFGRIINYYIHSRSDFSISDLGWGTKYKSEKGSKDLLASAKVTVQRHTASSNEKYYAENLETLNSIAQFCKKRNIQLLIFTSPAHKTYVENLNKKQLNHSQIALKQFIISNPEVIYYNWLQSPKFDSIDFYDADHFNEIGAKKFSLMLDDIIQSETSKH